MKILIISGYPKSNKRSGSLVHIEKLSQYLLINKDIEVAIITLGKNKIIKRDNLTIYSRNIFTFLFSLLFPFCPWSIQRQIRKINPDILHAAGTFPYTTLAVLMKNEYPSLITIFSLSKEELRWEKKILRILRKIMVSIPNERYVIQRIKNVIVQSSFTHKFIKQMTDANIYIIPEGIEIAEMMQSRITVPVSNQPDIFIAVRLRKLKGLDILIKAMNIVKCSIPNIKLYIAGSGEEEENLKKLVMDLDLEDNVRFLGFISDQDTIRQYYNMSKLIIVPSRWDIEPFASLEGAVFGKPIIATKQCNTSLAIDGVNGYVIDSEDTENLAKKIVTILQNDELRKQYGKVSKEVVKEYDWNRITERTVEVYKKIINEFQGSDRNGCG